MRYVLQVKAVAAPTGGGDVQGATNPAFVNRPSSAPLDPGRPWSGDVYDEGPVSDPSDAYAHFQGDGDTEAWLDKQDDGTTIGWVRDGSTIYRYPDGNAWALDVDGAQMKRTDAAVAPPASGDPAAPDTAAPADPTAGASAGDQGPAETAVPTSADPPAADPTATPDPQAEADAAANASTDPASASDTGNEEFVNPFAVVDEAQADGNGDAAALPNADLPAADNGNETPADQLFKKKKAGEKKSADRGIASGPTRRARGSAAARARAARR